MGLVAQRMRPARYRLGPGPGPTKAYWQLRAAGYARRVRETRCSAGRAAAPRFWGRPQSAVPPPGSGLRGRTAGSDGTSRSRYQVGGREGRARTSTGPPRAALRSAPPLALPGRRGEPTGRRNRPPERRHWGRPAGALRWRVTVADRSREGWMWIRTEKKRTAVPGGPPRLRLSAERAPRPGKRSAGFPGPISGGLCFRKLGF